MVILFDGVCNLCNGFVQFVIKRDTQNIFQFASLQSNYGMGASAYFNLPVDNPETIVLFTGEKVLTESDAVLKITGSLSGIWRTTFIFYIIPRFLRNWVYRLIARNRYKIFGKRDSCMVPTDALKKRFVDNSIFTP